MLFGTLIKRTRNLQRPTLSYSARCVNISEFQTAKFFINSSSFFSSTTSSQQDNENPNDTATTITTTIDGEEETTSKDIQIGKTRTEQLAAFREFQKVATEMEWPAQNVRDELDNVVDISDMSFGSSEGHQETIETEESDDNTEPEEEISWSEHFPAGVRNTEKSFGVNIYGKISERDAVTLSLFVNDLGRIQPRYVTGLSSKQQRKLAKTIKRARHMGILPHTFRLPPDYAYMSPVQSTVPAKIMDDMIPRFDEITDALTKLCDDENSN
jgi:small subunit ribosomal protein S18